MRIYAVLFSFLWLCIWPSLSVAEPGRPRPTLEEIEQRATKHIEEGNPEIALEIYRYYEREMTLENWDRLQKDLLHNMAVASYRSGKVGEALAFVKQLYIIEPTPERAESMRNIEMLIEHQIYHKYPDTTFQRGEASNYALWESVHQYSQAQLRLTLIVAWSVLFLFIIASYLSRKHKKIHIFLSCGTAMTFIFTAIRGGFNVVHSTTNQTRFGVIEDGVTLYTEADYDSKPVGPAEFIPGMTVEIVTTVSGWVKVMRIDGEMAWIRGENLYLLRGRGDNHPAHFMPSLKRHPHG